MSVDLAALATQVNALAAAIAPVINRHGPVAQMTRGQVLDAPRTSSHGSRTHFEMDVTQDFGVFASVIQTAQLSVYYEAHYPNRDAGMADATPAGFWVNISLSYAHPGGGSNGSNVMTIWLDADLKLTALRLPDNTQMQFEGRTVTTMGRTPDGKSYRTVEPVLSA